MGRKLNVVYWFEIYMDGRNVCIIPPAMEIKHGFPTYMSLLYVQDRHGHPQCLGGPAKI